MPRNLTRILLLLLTTTSMYTSAQQIQPTIEQKISAEDATRKTGLRFMPTFAGTHRDNIALTGKDLLIKKDISEKLLTTPCVDSSFRKLFESVTDRNYTFYCSEKTNDGGILIGGMGKDRTIPGPWCGVITKFDSIGNHIWSKQVSADVSVNLNLTSIKELSDGSIITAGNYNDNDFFVSKLSSFGEMTWFKVFHSPLIVNCSSGNVYEISINEGLSGDVLVGGTIWNCPYPKYLLAFKLNSSGILQWSKALKNPSNDAFCGGIFYDAGVIKLINRSSNVYSGGDNVIHVDFVKLDYLNGSYLSHKSWKVDMPFPASFDYGFTNSVRSIRLANGNLCVYGLSFGTYITNQAITAPRCNVIEFNTSDDFVSAFAIRSSQPGNPSADRIKVDRNKKALISLYNNDSYPEVDVYLGSVAEGKLLHQREKEYRNKEVFWNNAEIFGDGSYVFINTIATIGQSNFFLEYSRLNNSDTASTCLGIKTNVFSTFPTPYVSYSFNWSQVIADPIVTVNNLTSNSTTVDYFFSPPCIQKAICDTMKIHGTINSCDYQQDFIFTCYRDYRCGARVNWTINPSVVQTFQVMNDTTIKIRLNQPWQGWLYAEMYTSCGLLKDSVLITISSSPGAVDLGPDAQLCPNNSIVLNAHTGYATYLWNTGAVDSVITITTPGQYSVTVTDACNNSFSDTILISNAPPVPLDLGADKIKCNNDTLHINAPSGFLNYNWGPDYNINYLTGQNVIVQPAMDTIYYVKAEKTPGCFAYDTVRITVKYSSPINLGADKSFCMGDSAVLDTGPGFNQYLWSNSSTNFQLTVYSAGIYSVIGTAINGCRSYDTLIIRNVWPNPVVVLDKNPSLCVGSSRVLQPGSFASYLWQDGSTQPTYTVFTLGDYYVSVTDNNFCKGSDTVRLTKIWSVPSAYLPADTSICNYGTTTLKPINSYNSYLWNTGSHAPTILITQPGIYWLEVTDNNQCEGRDSIVATLKECLKGFFIPTGFTPDNNGLNDYFKPTIGGHLKQYLFTIYNRWGQVIFSTNEISKGWDGKLKGVPQDGNVFMWTCKYQLEGETTKFQKGTLVLIR